ncbi:MAG: hypothetical protein IJB86_01825 [Clostridia bacterium]|nr:hypothetical protein [Clostridia bacterium]
MNKRIFCIFLVFTVALFSFVACEKRSKYGVLIVDEQGMEHVLATDENGVTIQDRYGNLVEVMTDSKSKKPIDAPTQTVTDESGEVISVVHENEYATNSITFPTLMQNGNVAENKNYAVTIPEGWVQEGSTRVLLKHTETGATVSFYDDMGKSVAAVLEEMENSRAILGNNAEYEFEQTDVKIGDKDAVCVNYKIGNVVRKTYVLSVWNTVLQIACTVDADKEQLVDFDSVLNSIRFK